MPCKRAGGSAAGQLGLKLALVGHSAAAEDLEDEHGAVDDLEASQRSGDVADLAAGQLAVKYSAFRAQRLGGKGGFFQLAAAQHDAGLGVWRFWVTSATASMWFASHSAASSARLRSQSHRP